MMNDFAQDAVSFAQDQYQTNLDYSDESIRAVEKIFDILYRELPRTESGEMSEEASVRETGARGDLMPRDKRQKRASLLLTLTEVGPLN